MCGRFVSASPPDELARYFGALPEASIPPSEPGSDEGFEPNYNVAPTNQIFAVRAVDRQRSLALLRWGLVPFWAKDLGIGAKMINARAETAPDKPAFRAAYRKRRCLVPVDGFYEWAKVPGRRQKQPYYIHRNDGELLVFAGLWERWSPSDQEADGEGPAEVVETCTILTTSANKDVEAVHDRMPVMLAPGRWDDWLDPSSEPSSLRELLAPPPNDLLTLRPISTLVNRVANKGPELLDEVVVE